MHILNLQLDITKKKINNLNLHTFFYYPYFLPKVLRKLVEKDKKLRFNIYIYN